MSDTKTVELPLRDLNKCFQCQQKHSESTPLRVCQNCAEVLYCSEDCQRSDWPSHKQKCGRGKTDRIDLKKFYPFLACLAEGARFNAARPMHKALNRAILNNPSPNPTITSFPDGSTANLVILGEQVSLSDVIGWWPSAATSPIRSKFFRRIQREGHLLPILVSLCIALLREMYTSTPETGRRVRLRHGKSPIADFGIARGKAAAQSHDRLAYLYLAEGTFEQGQDPDEHYWLYFTTLSGQKLTLDVGMFVFNFCLYVSGQPYFDHIPFMGMPPMSAPAFYVDPDMARHTPKLTTASAEYSFLGNEDLQKALTAPRIDWITVNKFIVTVSGKAPTGPEKALMKSVTQDCCKAMATIVRNRAYMAWPEEPSVDIETDPGETTNAPTDDDEEWLKYMTRWNKKYNRGKVSRDALRHAIEAFRDRRTREPRSL